MRPVLLPLAILLGAVALPQASSAAMVGDVAACAGGKPAIKVHVSGFKRAQGNLRFALYDQKGWLKKGASLKKLQVPVTGDPMDVCIAVPQAGAYGVAVHHDVDGDKQKDTSDGAGFSRNPRLSLFGRPSFDSSRIDVGDGVQPVAIQLMYLRGLAIGPVRNS